jgi:hypothetical protein
MREWRNNEKLSTSAKLKLLERKEKRAEVNKDNRKYNTQVVKINVKVNERVTSVTVRKDLAALFLLMTDDVDADAKALTEFVKEHVIPNWKKSTGRGLSDFVSRYMVRSILSARDFHVYNKIRQRLSC